MPSDVLEVTTKFMNDPIKILVKQEELTLQGIRQFYVNVEREVSFQSESDVFLMILFRSGNRKHSSISIQPFRSLKLLSFATLVEQWNL